ncbi:UNVERIFIED_CONTAM: hypothetical protein RMT77_006592 [Armadillidium vulgare]
MSGQLFNDAFGDIFPSSQFALIPGLLISTFYLAFKPSNTERNPPNAKVLKPEYDFIIVGAGSAGAVVANRLSETPDFQVLLLEAGGDETGITDTPAFAFNIFGTEKDWNYTIDSDSKFCLSEIDKKCLYPRGKILGGSSAVNLMAYVRGNKRDYDQWASAGNYGWSFEEVLPYFKKSEDNRNPTFAKNKRYHSTKGELTVSDERWTPPLCEIFVKAGQELGYNRGDINAENQTVFAIPQLTMRDGYRCSTNKAFLVPAGKRKNLDIAKYSHVTKVLIDPATNRAYGVRFFRYGEYHDVLARKEVILSAGAINTPQLLMLSGIGPKDHLKDLNIPLIKDLPVGFNLHDHFGFFLRFSTDKPVTFTPERYNNLLTNMTYELFQKGPLSSPTDDGTAFVNSKFQDPKDDYPDLQLVLLSFNSSSDGNITNKQWQLSNEHIETFSIIIVLNRPLSRGRLFLRSNNPFEKPVLKMNYFDNENDVKRLADGGRIVLDLIKTKVFKRINAKHIYSRIPWCPKALPPSDEYFECLMRYNTEIGYHACGTAKMGPKSDPKAIVDPELRVRGISNFRVVDASIMPKVLTGNINAPTIMIGEKGSDLIKATWIKY